MLANLGVTDNCPFSKIMPQLSVVKVNLLHLISEFRNLLVKNLASMRERLGPQQRNGKVTYCKSRYGGGAATKR